MKTKYWIGAVVISIAASFFLGRCNAPTTTISQLNHEIDSLKGAALSTASKMEELEKQAIQADKRADVLKTRKLETIIIFKKDTAFSHAQAKLWRDSISKLLAHVPQSDSSELTSDFADGVLDLGSELKMLRSDTSALAHIVRETEGSKDFYSQALDECKQLVSNLESQAVAIKTKGDKIKWYEWVILGAAFVLGLAIP